jgi:hypothetical protein
VLTLRREDAMTIESEAIQVAAVAAALVESCTRPEAVSTGRSGVRGRRWWDPIELVLRMVRDERARQEEKWGRQRHTSLEWLMILAEEVGELAAEVDERSGEAADAGSRAVTRLLGDAGREARRWIEEHPWPEPQQRVIDEEKGKAQ